LNEQLFAARELESAATGPQALARWRARFDAELKLQLKCVIEDTLAEAAIRLNELGHELKPFRGPMEDPYGYADYEKSESVKLWLTVNVVITNDLILGKK
jgi:hypothetical protein